MDRMYFAVEHDHITLKKRYNPQPKYLDLCKTLIQMHLCTTTFNSMAA